MEGTTMLHNMSFGDAKKVIEMFDGPTSWLDVNEVIDASFHRRYPMAKPYTTRRLSNYN